MERYLYWSWRIKRNRDKKKGLEYVQGSGGSQEKGGELWWRRLEGLALELVLRGRRWWLIIYCQIDSYQWLFLPRDFHLYWLSCLLHLVHHLLCAHLELHIINLLSQKARFFLRLFSFCFWFLRWRLVELFPIVSFFGSLVHKISIMVVLVVCIGGKAVFIICSVIKFIEILEKLIYVCLCLKVICLQVYRLIVLTCDFAVRWRGREVKVKVFSTCGYRFHFLSALSFLRWRRRIIGKRVKIELSKLVVAIGGYTLFGDSSEIWEGIVLDLLINTLLNFKLTSEFPLLNHLLKVLIVYSQLIFIDIVRNSCYSKYMTIDVVIKIKVYVENASFWWGVPLFGVNLKPIEGHNPFAR